MAQPRRTALFDRAIVRAGDRATRSASSTRASRRRTRSCSSSSSGAVLVTVLLVRDVARGKDVLFNLQIALWLWFTLLFANFAEAMAEGRGKAQAAALRRGRTETMARRLTKKGEESVPATSAAQGRPGHRRGRPGDPGRRHRRRGHRLRRRVGDHRRVGSGHPGVRRRPVRRHRRHARPLGPDRRRDHLEPRRDVPRPHDRARRGRLAPEDPQRDRPLDPARGPDDRLPDRDGHAAALRPLRAAARRRRPSSSRSSSA